MSSLEPVQNEAADDDDFTDIELTELDSEAADGRIGQAHVIADRLRAHADQLTLLDEAPLSDHVEYYQRAHADLQRALSDIDTA